MRQALRCLCVSLAAGATTLLSAAHVHAQASFTTIPLPATGATMRGLNVSPNGQWVSGFVAGSDFFGPYVRAFRYNVGTGVLEVMPRAIDFGTGAEERTFGNIVTNEGVVFSEGDLDPASSNAAGWTWRPNNTIAENFIAGIPNPVDQVVLLGDLQGGFTIPAASQFVKSTLSVIGTGYMSLGTGNSGSAFNLSLQPSGCRFTEAGNLQGSNGFAVGFCPDQGYLFSSIINTQTLTPLGAGFFPSARTISDGPVTVAGLFSQGAGLVPARWRDGSITVLTTPPLAGINVTDMSNDGNTIVGYGYPTDSGLNITGLIWRDSAIAAQDVASVLAGVPGAPSNPNYLAVEAISADGTLIAGTWAQNATQQNPSTRAFVARLPSPIDSCATARQVSYGSWFESTLTADRTINVTCASEAAAGDIFFRFTPVATETITIDTCGSDFNTTLQVFAATGCGPGASIIACNDDTTTACPATPFASRVSVTLTQNVQYFIRVSGFGGSRGNVRLNITAPTRPVNDACSGAIFIEPGFRREFTTVGSLADVRPPCPGTIGFTNDVWFRTRANETGRLVFSTCGSSFPASINYYVGAACESTTTPGGGCVQAIGCSGSNGVETFVSVVEGQEVLLRVGSVGSPGTGFIDVRNACSPRTFSSYDQTIASDNPLGHWNFGDAGRLTAADNVRSNQLSCGNFPGVYNSNNPARPDIRGAGRAFGGLSLSGDGSRVDRIIAPPPFDTACALFGAYTLEAWVRTTDPLAGGVITHRLSPDDGSPTIVIGYSPLGNQPGRVMFVNDAPGVFTGAISSVRVDTGRWHHIVGVRSFDVFAGGWQYAVYVDGVLQGVNNLAGVGGRAPVNINGDNWWTIGSAPAWGITDGAFNGDIDDVALYCSALTPARVLAHWNAGAPPCDLPASLPYRDLVLQAGARGYWRFEDPGTTARDDVQTPATSPCGNNPGLYNLASSVPGGLYGRGMRPSTTSGGGAGVRLINTPLAPELTIEAWIKDFVGGAGTLVNSRTDASQTGLNLSIGTLGQGNPSANPNRIYFTVDSPAGNQGVSVFAPNNFLGTGRWHHVVAVRKRINPFSPIFEHLIYIDGELQALNPEGAPYQTLQLNSFGWAIGDRVVNPSNSMFKGVLDEVAIYHNAQTRDQIAQRFITGTNGCFPVIYTRLPAQLDQVAGDTIVLQSDIRSTRPITYQWLARFECCGEQVLTNGLRPDGTFISGANTGTLTISNLSLPDWDEVIIELTATTDCGAARLDATSLFVVPGPGCDSLDFNNDGVFPEDADFAEFLRVYGGGICPTCNDLDFNNDGVFPDEADILTFLLVLGGGNC